MPRVNEDPHEAGYLVIPLNRVAAIVPTESQARSAVRRLLDIGFDDQAIDVFVGPEGAELIDLPADRHGFAMRVLRNIETLFVDESEVARQRADEALRSGALSIFVSMEGKKDRVDEVAAVLKEHGGSLIRYWTRWTVTHLG
jgi:hypothetical protein